MLDIINLRKADKIVHKLSEIEVLSFKEIGGARVVTINIKNKYF